MSGRNTHRTAYPKDLTDDEDSDISDRETNSRSNRSRRESYSHKGTLPRTPRKNSSSGYEFENDNEPELEERKFQRVVDKRPDSNEKPIRHRAHKIASPSPPPTPKIAVPIPFKPKLVAESNSAFQPVKQIIQPTEVTHKPNMQPNHLESSEYENEEEEEVGEEDIGEEADDDEPELKTNSKAVAPIANLDEEDLGPPPEAPDHEWECEFCTFVNEANTKICLVCCKTPTQTPSKRVIKLPPKPKTPSPVPIKLKPASPVKQTTSKKIAIAKKADTKKLSNKSDVTNKLEQPTIEQSKGNQLTIHDNKKTTSEESSSDAGKMKGRNLRKISFWPGTKTK